MKTKIYLYTLFLISTIAVFFSCTKDIDVKIPDYQQKLVVDGSIEDGAAPTVQLTWTIPYFGNVEISNYQQFIVSNAFVTVNDGFTTDTLQELIAGTGFYAAPNMTGINGRTYTLMINVNGESYSSVSTMKNPIPLDSLFFKAEVGDSLGYLWAHISEPSGLGNNYRWYAKRIGKDNQFLSPLNGAFDDKFIDGKAFDFAYDRATAPNSNAPDDKNEEQGYFKDGDSVVVKFCHIGEKEYKYLRSYYANLMSNGNPFAAPSTLESNVEGNAIGMWCAYGAAYHSIRLKKP